MEWIQKNKQLLLSGSLILVAIISFFIIADSHMVMNLNNQAITQLDEKKETVMTLIFASGSASMGLEAIPGEVGTNISENIADLAMYLSVVLGGIWIQKYLLSLTALLAFKILVPIAFVLWAGNVFLKREDITQLITKLLMFAGLIFCLIPVSVWVSNHIESYHAYSSNQSIEQILNEQAEISQSLDQVSQTIETAAEENKDLWGQITGAVENAGSQVSSFVSNMVGAIGDITERAETFLGNLIEAVVVLIITTCVLPILVCWLFIWGINLIFGLTIRTNYNRKDIRKAQKSFKKMVRG